MGSPPDSSHHPLIRLLLLLTVVLWGSTFVATKICLDYLTPAEIFGLRLLLAVPSLYLLIRVQHVRLSFNSPERKRLLLGSGILTVHFLIQITGMQYTSATNSGWIISVSPLVLIFISHFFLKERIGVLALVGVAISTCGIFLLISGGDFSSLAWLASVGDWLVLASAFTWAIFTALSRNISRSHNPLAVTFAFLFPATVVMTVYVALTSDWHKFAHLPAEPVVAIVFLGVIAMGFANWWWQKGVAAIGAAKTGTFLYVEPLATTMVAVPLLHEPVSILTFVSGFLILSGVYLSQRRRR